MVPDDIRALSDYFYDNGDVGECLASGSFQTDGMIVVPCSMKTLAGIHSGYSSSLLLRACDVTIKEQRRLVLVARESPLSPIHLRNMYELSQMGVMIVPPMMHYYSNSDSLESWTHQFAQRVLGYFGLATEPYEWQGL